MLTEYFAPYDFGGSEWSTYYLAKGLPKKKYRINILTPNYGNSQIIQIVSGFRIIRFPFYKKINDKRILTPFWQTNILWIIWTSVNTIFFCLKYKIDLIHVQGKYFLPAAIFCRLFLNKKVVITLRDYIVLCPLGMCILNGNKACNLQEYFLKDFPKHLKIYHSSPNFILTLILFLAAIRARLISYFIRLLLKFVDKKIVISKLQRGIYFKSGIKIDDVIGNSVSLEKRKFLTKRNNIVYAGRLTPGKGPQILIESVPKILQKFPQYSFIFCGDGFLKNQLIKMSKTLFIDKKVKFLGRVAHQKLQGILSEAKLTIIPSIWPENFGRIVIESLANATPVVVTNRVGPSDYIKKNQWGIVTTASTISLEGGILEALKNLKKIQSRILNDKSKIKKIWQDDIINAYDKLYQKLAK